MSRKIMSKTESANLFELCAILQPYCSEKCAALLCDLVSFLHYV